MVKTTMKKTGQGAMEYLMTYGWAILVVIIVGVVLWQMGLFNPTPGPEPSCSEVCEKVGMDEVTEVGTKTICVCRGSISGETGNWTEYVGRVFESRL